MSHAYAGRSTLNTTRSEKGRVDVTRVKRYWKGKAPEWIDEKEESVEAEKRRETTTPVIVAKTADPRLERLSLSDARSGEAPTHRRLQSRVRESDAVSETIGSESVLEDQQAQSVYERRAQLRLKLMESRRDEQALFSDVREDEDGEGETSSEASESDDDGDTEAMVSSRPVLMKPVFVSAEARETVHERQRNEEEEEREWEAQRQKLQQRIEDTKAIVAAKIQEDEDALQNRDVVPTEAADINTDEDEDEEDVEFEGWKQRELDRIKRDKDEQLLSEKYAEEREKLKNMTEEERIAYEKLNPKIEVVKVKKKWKYLQKYWHKGAYYQVDSDDIRGTGTDVKIFDRDFSDPTGEDKIDKQMLPTIMQVKNFGRSGRTKWTHLVNEDTTQHDDPWTAEDNHRAKHNRHANASEQEFQKPKRFKS